MRAIGEYRETIPTPMTWSCVTSFEMTKKRNPP